MTDIANSHIVLQTPKLALLDGYEDAMARGWSPYTHDDVAQTELKKLRADPALASTVFVTTCTDIGGFMSFLGLATLLLKFLA